MFNWCKDEKKCCFAAGIAVGLAGWQFLKSKTARKACVTTMAQGMKLQKDAQVLFESMKEDAQDIYYEAEQDNITAQRDEQQ